MEIENIKLKNIEVRRIDIPSIIPSDPTVLSSPLYVPVVIEIGQPIVNVPGCVEAHQTNNPKNNQIKSDDPKGTVTICDAGIPSYDPINFEPEQIIPTPVSGVDTRRKEKENKPQPETKPQPTPPTIPPSTVNIQCPTQNQLSKEPIGFIFDGGRKEIVGYKLEGTQCVRIVEDVSIVEQVVNAIPPAGVITTTTTIAVVATSSALLSKPFVDLLLKVIKPTIKKVMKKIATIRGKELKVLSVEERRVEQRQRSLAIRTLREALKPKK